MSSNSVGFYTRALVLVADAFHYVRAGISTAGWGRLTNHCSVNRPRRIRCSVCRVQGADDSRLVPITSDVEYQVSERGDAPKVLPFGWQRATLLGAFFNGVFLLGLGVSILLQSIERFVSIERAYQELLQVSIRYTDFDTQAFRNPSLS